MTPLLIYLPTGPERIPFASEYELNRYQKNYFRYEGQSCHAGEYQNYLDFFHACLQDDTLPKHDLEKGL